MVQLGRIVSVSLLLVVFSLPMQVSAQLYTLMPLPTLQGGCHLIISFDVGFPTILTPMI